MDEQLDGERKCPSVEPEVSHLAAEPGQWRKTVAPWRSAEGRAWAELRRTKDAAEIMDFIMPAGALIGTKVEGPNVASETRHLQRRTVGEERDRRIQHCLESVFDDSVDGMGRPKALPKMCEKEGEAPTTSGEAAVSIEEAQFCMDEQLDSRSKDPDAEPKVSHLAAERSNGERKWQGSDRR